VFSLGKKNYEIDLTKGMFTGSKQIDNMTHTMTKTGRDNKSISITIIGNYGNFNLGDEILLKQIIDIVKNEERGLRNKKFYVPTRNPEFVKMYHDELADIIHPVAIRNRFDSVRVLLKSDHILIGGGGIWSRFTGPIAHLIPIIAITSKILGKRVEFISVGIYNTASFLDRLLVNLAFLVADPSSVRDEESYSNLWMISRKKTTVVDDLSIPYLKKHGTRENAARYVASVPEYKLLINNKKRGRLTVGISLKPLKDKDRTLRLVNEFSEAINSLNERHRDLLYFVFFPFAKTRSSFENDPMLYDIILNKLKIKDNFIQISHCHPLAWFFAIGEFVDVFIGMRYHSIIFAFGANKPVLCVPYERKIIQYLQSRPEDQESTRVSIVDPNTLTRSDVIDFLENKLKGFT
jgi:polysaccharide pyruvyl transferase WcaK-like protein